MPQFPFRTDVGDDLRALFEHDRVDAQSNDLGLSSLSPGEGTIDILDANDNVIAQYGHAAGKAGFLVPRGSGWQTVQEWAAQEVADGTSALAGRVGTAESRLDSHASRIGAAEGRLDSHASRIGAAEGRLDSHATRLGRHENEMETIDGKLVTAYNTLESRVAQLEGKTGNPINPTPIVKG